MYETVFEIREDEEEVRRRLAYWLEEYWKTNQVKIEDLGRYFFGASVALTLQLVFSGPWPWQLRSPEMQNVSRPSAPPPPPPPPTPPPPPDLAHPETQGWKWLGFLTR
jgi:hypothetical protein